MLSQLRGRFLPLKFQLHKVTAPMNVLCKRSPIMHRLSTVCSVKSPFNTYMSNWPSSTSNLSYTMRIHSSACCLKKRKVQEEPEKHELDLLRYDMRALKDAPKPALYLGLGGLIPFISAPLLMSVTTCYYPEVAFAQVAYGASILSFLGGVRWGFAIPENSPAKLDWMNLTNSVVPPLLAWLALLFRENTTEATLLVIMGLGIALHYDLALLPTYPSWFKALRAILTLVAVFSLVATLIVAGLYPHKPLVTKEK
ncbi:transmembrane protein 69 [Bombina bombina]|uniref:transmembrane protein 69 n=1 Tax=Bombina bombina TaxID=8345 RepID=UPI00235AB775|nr:transmembrane protein 69 [Bombina bombina]XP_053550038.1 transmembrane protein 69 [Bombina bombina]XP_053550039.1 transmembrane protein 69 [Bombina bombina]